MAASEVEICNSALIKLGADRITSLDDDLKPAILCKERYAPLRNEVLSGHPWNFALSRTSDLGLLAANPNWHFTYAFQLPTDCLRVLKTDLLSDEDFKIEADQLLCNTVTVKILYIKKITDTTLFRPYFDNALAWRLAADLAYSLTQSATMLTTCATMFEAAVARARSFDAQEGRPDAWNVVTWLNSRF